jgi:DNA polymerase-3 subunit beta
VLTALLVRCSAEGLTFAAADGFRLARTHLPGTGLCTQDVLIPARAAGEIGRLLGGAETAELLLSPNAGSLHVKIQDTVLFARLVEGTFPDIERVIPRAATGRVTVEAAAFRQAVTVAALFGGPAAGRPVRIEAREGQLRLHARGDETGDTESELPATLVGEPQVVVLSTPLLTDILAAATGNQLVLDLSGATSPVVVREAEREGTDDLWLVMPLHAPGLSQPNGTSPVPGAQDAQARRDEGPSLAVVSAPPVAAGSSPAESRLPSAA